MGNLSYLFAAFAVIWVGLLGYVFFLVQKQGQLRRDIDRFKEALKKEEGGTGEFHYKETKEFRGPL